MRSFTHKRCPPTNQAFDLATEERAHVRSYTVTHTSCPTTKQAFGLATEEHIHCVRPWIQTHDLLLVISNPITN